MKTITLPAKRNGDSIIPIHPIDIPLNARLFIMIATPENEQEEEDDFRADWLALGEASLARAYSDDEPEYDMSMLKEQNPHYEAR